MRRIMGNKLIALLLIGASFLPRQLLASAHSGEATRHATTKNRLSQCCIYGAFLLSTASVIAYDLTTSSSSSAPLPHGVSCYTNSTHLSFSAANKPTPLCMGLVLVMPSLLSQVALIFTCLSQGAWAQPSPQGEVTECIRFSALNDHESFPLPPFTTMDEVEETFYPDQACAYTIKNSEIIPYLDPLRLFNLVRILAPSVGVLPPSASVTASTLISEKSLPLLKEIFHFSAQAFFLGAQCDTLEIARLCDDQTRCTNCKDVNPSTIRCAPSDAIEQLQFNCSVVDIPTENGGGAGSFLCLPLGRELTPLDSNFVTIHNGSLTSAQLYDLRSDPKEITHLCGHFNFTADTIASTFVRYSFYVVGYPLGSPMLKPRSENTLQTYSLDDLLNLAETIDQLLTETPPPHKTLAAVYRELSAKVGIVYNARPDKEARISCDNTCRIYPGLLVPPGGTGTVTGSEEHSSSVSRGISPSVDTSHSAYLSSSSSLSEDETNSVSKPPRTTMSVSAKSSVSHSTSRSESKGADSSLCPGSEFGGFGPCEWYEHFGIRLEPDQIPPLPHNLSEILTSAWPYGAAIGGPDLRVGNATILVLLPHRVNGSNLTINHMAQLANKPLSGYNASVKINIAAAFNPTVGIRNASTSYLVLLSRNTLPGTIYTNLTTMEAAIALLNQNLVGLAFELPRIRDAVLSVLLWRVRTGTYLTPQGMQSATQDRDFAQLSYGDVQNEVLQVNGWISTTPTLGTGAAAQMRLP